MEDKKIFIAIAIFTIVLTLGGIFVSSGSEKKEETVLSSQVEAVINENNFDWGEIGIDDGNVEKIFTIKNEGSETLQLSDVVTSCMCTTAQLALDGEVSPEFGMHSKSSYVMDVPSGKQAQLKVIFDPAFHGPSGVGPITRQVTVKTNDESNPQLKFNLSALVTK